MEDCEIVEKCLSNDKQSFNLLIDKYKKDVYKISFYMLGSKELATNSVKQVFTALYTDLSEFKGQSDFSVFLFRVTMKQLALLCKNNDDSQTTPFGGVLVQALMTLSVVNRQLIILREIEKLSYFEIGSILCISKDQVSMQLSEARKSLLVTYKNLGAL